MSEYNTLTLTLDTDLTVAQNLLYHASLHGITRKAAKARKGWAIDGSDRTKRLPRKAMFIAGTPITVRGGIATVRPPARRRELAASPRIRGAT